MQEQAFFLAIRRAASFSRRRLGGLEAWGDGGRASAPAQEQALIFASGESRRLLICFKDLLTGHLETVTNSRLQTLRPSVRAVREGLGTRS